MNAVYTFMPCRTGIGIPMHWREYGCRRFNELISRKWPDEAVKIEMYTCSLADFEKIIEEPQSMIKWFLTTDLMPNISRSNHLLCKKVPILFNNRKKREIFEIKNKTIVINADFVAACFFMLSRWEERQGRGIDCHGRSCATQSVAYRCEFLELPLIDYYAYIVRNWIQITYTEWKPVNREPILHISHDIDWPFEHSSICNAVKSQLNVFTTKLCAKEVVKNVIQICLGLMSPYHDKNYQAMYYLMDCSESLSIMSNFYIKADYNSTNMYDFGYDPRQKYIARIIKDINDRGHNVGYHASYQAFECPDLMEREIRALTEANGGKRPKISRAHYLRFDIEHSWAVSERLGMSEDSTLGYPEDAGFRAGTCIPFPVWHWDKEQEGTLIERPLIAMEGAFIENGDQELDMKQKMIKLYLLAERVGEVGGCLTLLWHNQCLTGKYAEWSVHYPAILRECLSRLVQGSTRN